MERQDPDRAERLFERALDLEASERERMLAELEATDAALARELRSLLAAHESAGEFLDEPAMRSPNSAGQKDLTGATIGDCRVLRLVARGGMGVVYEAEQIEPRRRVALKLLRFASFALDDEVRFRREIEILGRLRHPGIAQVLAGGVAEFDGTRQPYMALELVPEARGIVAYAADRDLSERCDLFLAVCDAVHYAHLRGVVHRDLKPANLLVDRQGRARVIDFGIARLIDDDEAARTRMTEAGQILGTLEYMSPEQCDGDVDDLDVRTDVYSLGLVLYELVVGRRAFDLDGLTVTGALRRRLDPITAPRAVRPEIERDLEAVILRALEPARERRYASVQEFADDLRRFREHVPTRARPPRPWRAAALFARRHRVLVAATAVVVITLAAATAFSLRQMNEARAQVAARTETLNFVLDIFRSDTPEAARGESRRLRDVLGDLPDRIDERLGHDPYVQSLVCYHFGRLAQLTSQGELAQRMLERAIEVAGRCDVEPLMLARMRHALSQALPQRAAGRAIELCRTALAELPAGPATRSQRRKLRIDLGQRLLEARQFAAAERELTAVMESLQAASIDAGESLAVCLDGLAKCAASRGDVVTALDFAGRAIRAVSDGGVTQALVSALVNRGFLHKASGAHEAALEDYERASVAQRELDPTGLGSIEANLARLYLAMQRPSDMLEYQRRAFASFSNSRGADSFETVDVKFAAVADRITAGLLPEAEALAREILPAQRALLGVHVAVAVTIERLAHCVAARGDKESAAALQVEAAAIRAGVREAGELR